MTNTPTILTPILPQNHKTFTLKELQTIVNGTIDIQKLPKDHLVIVLNDNGKNENLPTNTEATNIWKKNYPIAEYPLNNDELIVGNVLICDKSFIN